MSAAGAERGAEVRRAAYVGDSSSMVRRLIARVSPDGSTSSADGARLRAEPEAAVCRDACPKGLHAQSAGSSQI